MSPPHQFVALKNRKFAQFFMLARLKKFPKIHWGFEAAAFYRPRLNPDARPIT